MNDKSIKNKVISVVGVGDIMPGGVLNNTNKGYLSDEVKNLLEKGDIRVGTLECAIGDDYPFSCEKMNRKADVIHAEDKDIIRLVEMNINVVSLANNHFFDLGDEGAKHTVELLEKNGIKHCGAGRNLIEASKPAVIEIKGLKIAFLGFCDYKDETVGWCPIAANDVAGVNPMYEQHVVREITKYRKLYDYVVIIPHWGREHTVWPTDDVYKMVHIMLKAGADLILGGHPHHIQPVLNYKKSSVALSMGNFLFPDRFIVSPRSTYYPKDTIDLNKVPVTDGYPYVSQLTYKIWRPKARVGMIVYSCLGKRKTFSSFSLIKNSSYNVLELVPCLSNKQWFCFKLISLLFLTHTYNLFDHLHVLLNSIKKNLKS